VTCHSDLDEKFEAFTAVKIQVEVFWIVTPCSVVLEVHTASIFRVSYYNTTRGHNPEDLYLQSDLILLSQQTAHALKMLCKPQAAQ
jgi:hypothetical protein